MATIIIGLGFIVMGSFLIRTYTNIRRLINQYDYVHDGIITEKRVWSKSRKSDAARPTVRFYVDGKKYESTSEMGQNPPVRIGKAVGVYYNPEDPSEVIINTMGQRGVVFLLLGLVFAAIGIFILYIGIQALFTP